MKEIVSTLSLEQLQSIEILPENINLAKFSVSSVSHRDKGKRREHSLIHLFSCPSDLICSVFTNSFSAFVYSVVHIFVHLLIFFFVHSFPHFLGFEGS